MHVHSITAQNLRCFEDAALSLQSPDKSHSGNRDKVHNVTLLLGDNGSGKTTILKAIALAVLAPVIHESGFKPDCLIRRSVEPAKNRRSLIRAGLTLHGQDLGLSRKFTQQAASATTGARISARGDYERVEPVPANGTKLDDNRLFDDESPAYFMVGYGATRRVASPRSGGELFEEQRRGLRYQRVAGLFEDYIALWPMKLWLPQLLTTRPARGREAVELINALTPSDVQFDGEFNDLQPIFQHRGISLPFTALSDGYRGFIGLVGDLLYHLQFSCPDKRDLSSMTGVVLIDDVDLHLHPLWQRDVMSRLSQTFPALQFIATTHSPIVAGSVYAENIRTIESSPDGPSTVRQFEERIHGLNVDQILTSSYFGMPSTRSLEQVRKLSAMAEVAAQRGKPDAAIAFLRELAGKEPE